MPPLRSPKAFSPAVAAAMRGNKRRDTKPELLVRQILHRLGYRYRIHFPALPRRRKIVQVHGCFWHQHPDPACRLRSRPRTSTKYRSEKLDRNVARDADQLIRLAELGWAVLTVWECECRDREALERRLMSFLGPTRATRRPATGG